MTKIFNFALKSKGVVGKMAHAKSSDPATPPKKIGTCTCLVLGAFESCHSLLCRGPLAASCWLRHFFEYKR